MIMIYSLFATLILILLSAGPRFVLNPIKIFGGSFGGSTLWKNPDYTSPNTVSN